MSRSELSLSRFNLVNYIYRTLVHPIKVYCFFKKKIVNVYCCKLLHPQIFFVLIFSLTLIIRLIKKNVKTTNLSGMCAEINHLRNLAMIQV
jgi:hypothetical protein